MKIVHFLFGLLLLLLTSATAKVAKEDNNNVTKRHPIILVPGDGGSRLMAKLNKTTGPHYWCYQHTDWYLIWLNLDVLFSRFMDCFVDNMRLQYNRTDGRTYNTDGVEVVVPDFGSTKAVENLSDWNYYFWRYTMYFYNVVEQLVQKLGYTRDKDLLAAPYDFRKAPNEMEVFLANLTKLTETAYYSNNNTRVVLVSHSYGCVMTLYWLHQRPQAWKDKFLEHFISLAGPYGGTALSYEVYAAGYNLNIWELDGLRLRKEQRTSPSLAFLSPNPLVFPKDTVFVSTPSKNYTLDNTQQFFSDINFTDGWEMWKETKPLLDITKPPGVSMYCVYGNGSATTERVAYAKDSLFPTYPSAVEKGPGDGTVNLRSLRHCESWRGRQPQPVTSKFYPDIDHMGLVTSIKVSDDIVAHIAGLAESRANNEL